MSPLSTVIVLLALSSAVLSASLPEDFTGRIVGGQTASVGQFPYQASLRSAEFEHFCGGSVIGKLTILSAAHCTIGRRPNNTNIVVGTNLRLSDISIKPASIINHEGYNNITMDNDISLVKSIITLTVFSNVEIIPLMRTATALQGASATVSGWGLTSYPGSAANDLQWLSTTIFSTNDCKIRYPAPYRQNIRDKNICTFAEPGKGDCMGDSGGPVTSGGKLVGIVSWGMACAGGYPDVNTRVSSYVAWITANANDATIS